MNLPRPAPVSLVGAAGDGGAAAAPNVRRGPEVGPVRADFTRQECAPPHPLLAVAALGVARLRGQKVWGAPPCPVTISPGRLPSPQTARAETGLGADPTLRLGRRGQGGASARAGWGTPNRPEARSGDPPQPDHERGRLSHGFSVPRKGARAVAVPERLGWERGAAPALPLPGATSSGARPYLQLLRAAAGAGLRAGRPLSQPRRQEPQEVRRRLPQTRRGASQLGRGTGEEGSRRPLSRTPPPQLCLDGCSREPATQLPFSPSFGPRGLRLLLPLLPPAPGPASHGAPPTRCASWRHAHWARRGRLWDAVVCSRRFSGCSP